MVLGYMVLFLLIGSLVTHFALVAENKKRLAGKRDHLIEGKTEQEIAMMGDKRFVLMTVRLDSTNLILYPDPTSSTLYSLNKCSRDRPGSMAFVTVHRLAEKFLAFGDGFQ